MQSIHWRGCRRRDLFRDLPENSIELQSIVFDFAGDNKSSGSAIRRLRELYPTFTLRDFVSHELYRDPKNLDRVVAALRKAGLPE